jgi:hypothetical protein
MKKVPIILRLRGRKNSGMQKRSCAENVELNLPSSSISGAAQDAQSVKQVLTRDAGIIITYTLKIECSRPITVP